MFTWASEHDSNTTDANDNDDNNDKDCTKDF